MSFSEKRVSPDNTTECPVAILPQEQFRYHSSGASMVDIHSHILPKLDDGSTSLEESIAMVRMAVESGTTAMVATPHASSRFQFDFDAVREKASELRANIPEIAISTGCDFHLSFDNLGLFMFRETPPTPDMKGPQRRFAEMAYHFYQDWTSGRLPRMLIVVTEHATPY